MDIIPADLSDPRIISLLEFHLARARAVTPPGSTHALDLSGLRSPAITVWAAWEGEELLAVGALQQLAPDHGEVKSMHVAKEYRGRGVGAAMLRHLLSVARERGYSRLSLETGTVDYFGPARALYLRHGFTECPPFGKYLLDPNNVFMTLEL